MSKRLPVFIDPIRLADMRRELKGVLSLKDMDRLTPYLVDAEGEVAAELEFGVDDQKIRYMRGRLRADLPLCCQRCMQTTQLAIDREINLGLVNSEVEAEQLSNYDPLIVVSREMRLSEIIEDELLLALPMIAMHPDGACQPLLKDEVAPQEAPEPRKSPFEILAELKKRQ